MGLFGVVLRGGAFYIGYFQCGPQDDFALVLWACGPHVK